MDLGGGAGRPGAAHGVDVIGVGGRDRERDRGFGGEVAQLVAGRSDGEQYPDRTAAELQRRDGRARQKLFEDGPDGRNALTRELRGRRRAGR